MMNLAEFRRRSQNLADSPALDRMGSKTGSTAKAVTCTVWSRFCIRKGSLAVGGIECDEHVVTRREGKGIEKEADEFAAALLMPLDDFRARIGADDKPSMDDLDGAANRYGVSLTAAALRWLEYTNRRAVFVVSRDGP